MQASTRSRQTNSAAEQGQAGWEGVNFPDFGRLGVTPPAESDRLQVLPTGRSSPVR